MFASVIVLVLFFNVNYVFFSSSLFIYFYYYWLVFLFYLILFFLSNMSVVNAYIETDANVLKNGNAWRVEKWLVSSIIGLSSPRFRPKKSFLTKNHSWTSPNPDACFTLTFSCTSPFTLWTFSLLFIIISKNKSSVTMTTVCVSCK